MKKPEEKNIRQNVQKSSEPVEKKPAEKGKKNSSIYVVMYSFVFLFLGMIAYLCLYVKQNGQDLLNNSYNTRQKILLAQNGSRVYNLIPDSIELVKYGDEKKDKPTGGTTDGEKKPTTGDSTNGGENTGGESTGGSENTGGTGSESGDNVNF